MKNNAVALAVLMACGVASAGLPRKMQWEGEFISANGNRMSIHQHDNILEVLGSDEETTYRLVCIITASDNAAQCVGDGVQRKDQARFIYRSKMQRELNLVKEQWEAIFNAGETKGEVLFKPASGPTRAVGER